MADEIKENKKLDEGYTEFGGSQSRAGMLFQPTGPIGKFFAKFFASTAQAQAVKTMDSGGPYSPSDGDEPKETVQRIRRDG